MPEIRAEIISTPFSGASDYHLMRAERGPETESFLFIPRSDAPGLGIDLIRLDLLPRRSQRLQDVFNVFLSQLVSNAGSAKTRHAIISSSPKDIVFHFSFAAHPLAGDQHTICRLMAWGKSICGIQVLRKLEALTAEEVSARVAFVRDVHVDPAALQAGSKRLTDFAKSCLANTTHVVSMFQRMAQERKEPDNLDTLLQVLTQASPVHEEVQWALLAKFAASKIVGEGRIEAFASARRMLGLAALHFDDTLRTEGQFFVQQILSALGLLGELRLYEIEGERRVHVQRAAGTWRLCAELEGGQEAGRSAQFEVMAAFADALAGMDLSAPLDIGLGRAAAAVFHEEEQIQRIVAWLYETAHRMAYVARRHGRDEALLLGACLAADFAQFLLERATALGSLDFRTYVEESISISKWQIDAQMALFGVSQADLDEVSRSALAERLELVYLRPLGTARRELLPNRFTDEVKRADERHRLLPDRISIEAALQVALTPTFATYALGGPIDLFGMQRGTILGGGPDSWQGYAQLMIGFADLICVLPADSEGLAWELSEILRQGAAGKTIFVLPPREGTVIGMSPAARKRLENIGYTLPDKMEPGFFLLNAGGSCEPYIPFDHLWDGRLSTELRARLHVRPPRQAP